MLEVDSLLTTLHATESRHLSLLNPRHGRAALTREGRGSTGLPAGTATNTARVMKRVLQSMPRWSWTGAQDGRAEGQDSRQQCGDLEQQVGGYRWALRKARDQSL
jgi:hypothetical protein